jgi:hypothetical protein
MYSVTYLDTDGSVSKELYVSRERMLSIMRVFKIIGVEKIK